MAATGKHDKHQKAPENKMGDLSERLKDLSGRIDTETNEHQESQKRPDQSDQAQGYAKGLRLIAEFVAGPLVGGLIGYGLDRLFGLSVPIFLIVFMLLGFGAGILNLARAGKKSLSEESSQVNPADRGSKKEADRG